MRLRFRVSLLLVGATIVLRPQPQSTSIGYTAPYSAFAGAGQVVTLFVPDLHVPDAVAPGTSWPNSLSGVTVGVRVISEGDASGYPTSLPIYRVYTPKGQCPVGVLVCPYTQVTVQIPFETICVEPPNRNCYDPAVVLNVKGNGTTAPDLPLNLSAALGHILDSCDAIFGPSDPASCHPLITHAGGLLVNKSSPARVGETLVLYAVGLGVGVKTGSPSPGGIPTPGYPWQSLTWSYLMQVLPDSLTWVPLSSPPVETFEGTVANYVGLYQVNFVVPPMPAQTHQCQNDSNASVSFFNMPSMASPVLLCVQP